VLLAAVGVYGVIAYSVQQRTHEIGIRLALGASPAHVLRAVVGEGIWLALAGLGLGVAAAAGAVRLIASYLFGVRPTEPGAFAICGVLLVVAAIASYLPARRAASVDPLIALRHE
jgi:putative ABC transport system permease protein